MNANTTATSGTNSAITNPQYRSEPPTYHDNEEKEQHIPTVYNHDKTVNMGSST